MEQPTQAESSENFSQIKLLLGIAKKLSWFISACAALLVFFFLRKFFFDIVRVNNRDMEDTYHYGDALLIKKSFNSYKIGDVVYLEYPLADEEQSGTRFFQRIMGLPGDSIQIAEKRVYVNGREIEAPPTIKHNYFISSKDNRLDSMFMLSHKLTEGGLVANGFDYSFSLTREQSEALINNPQIKSVQPKVEKNGSYDENCFPCCSQYCWNRDHYGKIYVPKKNDTLLLDTVSINLFSNLISECEKNSLEVRHDSILINSTLTNKYVVKQNYYFVMGDNRDNANDSRAWGYLPEKSIKAKVIRRIKRAHK